MPKHLNHRHSRLVVQLEDETSRGNRVSRELFQHPAHSHYLSPQSKAHGWKCHICLFEQTQNGEQRQHIQCFQQCDFHICGNCMSAEYSAWLAHKDVFVRGEPIKFYGFQFLGDLDIDKFPDSSNSEVLFNMLDTARTEGDLPWRSKQNRAVTLSAAGVRIIGDPNEVVEWERYTEPRVYYEYDLTEVKSITYLDDSPLHLVVILAGMDSPRCHVLSCASAELANSICDTSRCVFEYIHTQAVLAALDDSILAALEERPTMMQKKEKAKAEEINRKLNVQLRQRNSQPDPLREQHRTSQQSPGPQSPSFEDEGRRKSVFNIFPAFGKNSPAPVDSEDDPSRPGTPMAAASVADNEMTDLVHNYMKILGQTLTPRELQTFSTILSEFRKEDDLKKLNIALVELFGPSRKHLLKGMITFIPPKDRVEYDLFVARQLEEVSSTPSRSGNATQHGQGHIHYIPELNTRKVDASFDDPGEKKPASRKCERCQQIFEKFSQLYSHQCRVAP